MDFSEIDFRSYSLLLFVLSIFAVGGSFLLARHTAIGFSTWINTTGTVGSIFLSGLLVYLYFSMGETQQRQFEALKAQANLLENQQKPQLRFSSLEISSGTELATEIFDEFDGKQSAKASDFYSSATGIRCTIQNTGGGPATHLELNTDVYLSGNPNGINFRHISEKGYRFSSVKFARVDEDESTSKRSLMGGGGETLSPGESDTFYAFTGIMDLNKGLDELADFDGFSPISLDETIPDRGGFIALVEISIGYRFANNTSGNEVLYRVLAPANEITKLYEIEDYGRPIGPDLLQALEEQV